MEGLIQISKYAGMRNDLVQAGGGNTSVKLDDQIMAVKSSGYQLADVKEDSGWTKVNYRLIAEYFERNLTAGTKNVLTEKEGEKLLGQAQLEGGRASIESFLHAITGKYTLHTHPLLVNILTARKGGMRELKKIFPEAVFVPYKKPGAALADACYRAWKEREQTEEGSGSGICEIIFLENHGLVVSQNTPERVIKKTEEVMKRISAHTRIPYKIYPSATRLWDMMMRVSELRDMIVYPSENYYLSWEYIGESLVKSGLWNHAFCPDCVVYGSKKILSLEDDFTRRDIVEFMEVNGFPALICHRRHIFIVAESVKKAQEIENVMSFGARVQMANLEKGMNCLSEKQQNELLNWDSEKYRRMMK